MKRPDSYAANVFISVMLTFFLWCLQRSYDSVLSRVNDITQLCSKRRDDDFKATTKEQESSSETKRRHPSADPLPTNGTNGTNGKLMAKILHSRSISMGNEADLHASAKSPEAKKWRAPFSVKVGVSLPDAVKITVGCMI